MKGRFGGHWETIMHHLCNAAFYLFDHIQRGLMWVFNIKE